MSITDFAHVSGIVGGLLFVTSWVWAMIVAAREKPKWLWGIVPLFLLVFPFFFLSYRKQARKPMILYALMLLSLAATILCLGDLIVDRHPDLTGRTFAERFCGCGGRQLHADWAALTNRDQREWFRNFEFDPQATNYQAGNALTAARVSTLTYEANDVIFEVAATWGFPPNQTRVLKQGSQTAVVLANDALIVIAFRGTDDPIDWVHNFKVVPHSTPYGAVHKGFWDALDSLWPSLQEALASLGNQRQSIWLTGHSLGGALATLAAVRLKREKGEGVAGVYTFGQPQAGNRNFTGTVDEELGARYFRFVADVDAVVEAVVGMTHTGTEFYFDSEGRLHVGGAPGEQHVRDGVCAPMYEAGAEFKSHAIKRYVFMLERVSKGPKN